MRRSRRATKIRTGTRPGLLTIGLLFALAASACQSICPAGRDESVNPSGEVCGRDRDCFVECACDDGEERRGVLAGQCRGGLCLPPDDLCEAACLPLPYEGEFCFAD